MMRTAATLALVMMVGACSDYRHDPTAPYQPPPTPAAIDVSFCSGDEPQWLAFQDGDGAWTRAQPAVAGQVATYSHTFTSDRGAVATERVQASGLTFLSIQYGTPAELAIAGDGQTDLCAVPAVKTLVGTVTGIDSNEVAIVSEGRSTREATTPEEGNTFTLHFVPSGPQELFATRLTDTGDNLALTGYIIRRALDLPDGAAIPVLDFSSGEVIQPVARTVTFAGFGPDGAISSVGFRTAHSDNVRTFGMSEVVAPARTYYAVPEEKLALGDIQSISATTSVTANSNVVRSILTYFRAPTSRTLTFPAVPHAPTITVIATAPTARMRARFDAQPDYDRATGVHYQQRQNVVALNMTAAYAALNPGGYEMTLPEFTGVDGFDVRWALQPGIVTIWQSNRVGGTLGLMPGLVPADGDSRVIGFDAGFVTP